MRSICRGVSTVFPLVAIVAMETASPAQAACSLDASGNLSCSGTLSTPITVYDAAAAFQPTLGGNAYTPANPAFPAASNPNNPGYNPNPPTVMLNFDNTVSFVLTNPAAASLADKGLVAANFSNDENPAVNNVVIGNAGVIGLSTNQIASRLDTIVSDSQVNNFTVNNTGTISVTQTFPGFSAFSTSNLSVTSSGTPATYAAKYSGATLNDMAALYSDDNTNEFVVNNSGMALATGNYATVYYGRADTTINNSGTLANTSWTASDTIGTGHWAIATWAGADFQTAPGTNPDSNVVVLNNGNVTVLDTSATTITNSAKGVIKGDILVLDETPLVYAAGVASGATFPLAISGSNAGPRDSNIENFGLINGNFYLGSGTHVIDNAAGATINGNITVDQSPSQASFATAVAGTVAGTYRSAGGTDFQGNACPTAGSNTTNGGCAVTQNVLATYVGGQSFTLTNEGTLNGNITINDQPSSVNSITLTGTGFSGNVIALNGAGSSSLILIGVTNLASVQNFSALDLQTSQVTVPGGVSLVDGATLATTVSGHGGTLLSPSTNIGTIFGTLSLGGATSIMPSIAYTVHSGDVFQVASTVSGGDISVDNTSALVNFTSNTSTGALLLKATVLDPSVVPGLSNAGLATLRSLLAYNGSNGALEGLGGAVENLTSLGDVRSAGEQLRPAVSGAAIQVPIGIAALFQAQVDSRLDALLFGNAPSQQAMAASPAMAYADITSHPNGSYFKADRFAPRSGPDAIFWGNLVQSGYSQQAVGPVAGYAGMTSGLIVGADKLVSNNLRVGGAFGYALSSISDNQATSNSTGLQTYEGLIYGSWVQPSWYANASLGYALEDYTTNRSINFPGFTDSAYGTHAGNLFTARIDGGYPIQIGNGFVVPVASLTYAYLGQDAYTENSAAGAGLAVASAQNDSLRSELGVKTMVPVATSPYFTASVGGHAEWMHEFGDVTQAVTAGFAGGGGSFLAVGPTPDRNMLDVGADLRLAGLTERQSLTVSYSALVGATYLQQVGMLKARFALDDGFIAPDWTPGAVSKASSYRATSQGIPPWDAIAISAGQAFAQDTSGTTLPEIQVIGTTPLSASHRLSRPAAPAGPAIVSPAPQQSLTAAIDPSLIDRDKVPSNVQVLSASDFDHDKTPDLLQAMSQGLAGVALSDQTGSQFQLDLNYRGFTASPVIGTSQGIAVYQNGVRINEVFGDIVNWDFIPEKAVNQMTLAPSNPVYGLNAIGGAMSIEMKNGFTYHGVEGEVGGGSFGRKTASIEAGGQNGNLSGYIAADATNDDGWRLNSPSQLRRIYTDFGARGDDTEFHVTFTGASNNFGVAAATPVELLNQSWSSIYTIPQTTHNQLAFLTASGNWKPSDTWSIDGNVYYRGFWQSHVDGNGTDAQNSGCPDPTVLCFPNLDGSLSNLITTNGQTVPTTGTLGTSVLGEIDRTWTSANSFGGSLQAASSDKLFNHDNHFVVGVSIDRGLVQFTTSSELGTINANQFPFVQGAGIFIDQPSGDVAPVALAAQTLYTGVYTTDTFDVTNRLSVTVGGRFNLAQINLQDELGNDNLLNGDHTYSRFNPMVGATYKLTRNVTLYGDYSEANRAPTPLELGCSDPLRPCLIDNSLVGDPELKQVVSHTVEGGLRGNFNIGRNNGLLSWSVGVYHTENVDDIINVASPIPGHEFFQNGGNTMRQGIEAKASYKWDRWNVYANYTYVDATFLSPLTLSSPNNPFADANGNISVVPGDHMTGIPDFRFKAGGEYQITDAWKLGADLNVIGSQYLVGDESNLNPKVPAYWTVNLHTSYKVTKNVEVYGLVQNLFNQHYYTFGTFFETHSFPYLNLTDPCTFLPGMPMAAYAGLRATF